MIPLKQLVSQTNDLGPLPQTALKLAEVVARQDSTIDDVVKVIHYDQAMTIDILKFANSAVSASMRAIATLRDAVVRLGGARILEQARHVAGKMAVPLAAYGYAEQELWRHSVAAGVAAAVLGGFTKERLDGLLFTAALLHDIGKLILGRIAPQSVDRVWEVVAQRQIPCEQAEREVFGFSHADVGAEMALAWGLPDPLVKAIRYHHEAHGSVEALVAGVIVANAIARLIGEGIGNEGMGFAVAPGVVEKLGLTKDIIGVHGVGC
jgi:putative nucleotidyltransferase with HDIG domain